MIGQMNYNIEMDGDVSMVNVRYKRLQFFLSSGANGSALEHSVPEQLWSTTDNPAEGISAVTVSKTNITYTYNGWSGCGYIIIDLTTGTGAYMISGGMSGAWMVGYLIDINRGCFVSAEMLNLVPSVAFFLLGAGLESRGFILPMLISHAFSAFLVTWPFYFCQKCVQEQ